ncbi:MAG: hypothetical protein ABIJ34_05050 [archaeon]
MKKWTTSQLITIGAIAILQFLSRLFLYSPLLLATGNVFTAIISIMLGPFFAVLIALLIKKRGSVLIYMMLYYFIDLPLPKIYPHVANFILYIAIAISTELFFSIIKNKKTFSILSSGVYNVWVGIIGLVLYFYFGFQGLFKIPDEVYTPIGIILLTILLFFVGSISGFFAYVVYEKIKKTSVVKRIQR